MQTGLISFLSEVNQEEIINNSLSPWLKAIEKELDLSIKEYPLNKAKKLDLPLLFIKSGGVENIFKEAISQLKEPYILIASELHNSLPAALEILTYLRQQGKKAEIIHGSATYIARRIKRLQTIITCQKKLATTRAAVIGKPSDWLIASQVDYQVPLEKFGLQLIDISTKEFETYIDQVSEEALAENMVLKKKVRNQSDLKGALTIQVALENIVNDYQLNALTVRCFDLLSSRKNTGCLGLSALNNQNIIAGCEGDVPALLSMIILNYLSGQYTFMANPASLDILTNQVTFAHCTVPTRMVEDFSTPTHFESDLGVAIKGRLALGQATVFKLAADCKSYFSSRADILDNLNKNYLCRTQIRVALDEDVSYFLANPFGNHHIICKGDYDSIVREFFKQLL